MLAEVTLLRLYKDNQFIYKLAGTKIIYCLVEKKKLHAGTLNEYKEKFGKFNNPVRLFYCEGSSPTEILAYDLDGYTREFANGVIFDGFLSQTKRSWVEPRKKKPRNVGRFGNKVKHK